MSKKTSFILGLGIALAIVVGVIMEPNLAQAATCGCTCDEDCLTGQDCCITTYCENCSVSSSCWWSLSSSCGGGGGDQPWHARGTRVRFVYYQYPESVPAWPLTSQTGADAWAEGNLSHNICVDPVTSVRILGTELRLWGHWRSGGEWSDREVTWDPNLPPGPNCNNDYDEGISQARASMLDHDPNWFPSWYNHFLYIQIPDSSEYRQFGIKILNGITKEGEETTDGSRPVYSNNYTWGGSEVCTFDGTYDPNKCYPGYPVGTTINMGSGHRDSKKRQYLTNISAGKSWWGTQKRVCDGEECEWEDECNSDTGSCPAGYAVVRATSSYDHECGSTRGLVYTCKKIEGQVFWQADWKPEHQGPLVPNNTDYIAQTQRVKLMQDFTFTVDKSGNYYFVPCYDCTANMTINGSWDGWQDHYYEAGTKYTAHFECTDGECYYGLPAAPRANLPILTGTEGLWKIVWVPLVDKNPPEPQPVIGNIYERQDQVCDTAGASSSDALTINCTYGGETAAATVEFGEYACINPIDGDILFPAGSIVLVSYDPASIPFGMDFNCQIPESSIVDVPEDNTPGDGPDFILTQAQNAWFQTKGGDIHADRTGAAPTSPTISSQIPNTCEADPVCEPYLSLLDEGSSQPGVVSYASGDEPDAGSGSISSPQNWRALSGSYDGIRADYDFWRRHLGDELVEEDITSDPGAGFWLATNPGGTLPIGGNWNVAAGEQLVLLYDGNIQVNKDQTVDPGGSLMIVASGNITFGDAVTEAHGVYIASGKIITSDVQGVPFTGEGTFIGWNGISLNRDLGLDNNTQAAETFIYRPDIVYNLPTQTKRPFYTWRETW